MGCISVCVSVCVSVRVSVCVLPNVSVSGGQRIPKLNDIVE